MVENEEIKKLISKDIEKALNKLIHSIRPDTDTYNQIIGISSSMNRYKSDWINSLLSQVDYQILVTKKTTQLLMIIDLLQPSDWKILTETIIDNPPVNTPFFERTYEYNAPSDFIPFYDAARKRDIFFKQVTIINDKSWILLLDNGKFNFGKITFWLKRAIYKAGYTFITWICVSPDLKSFVILTDSNKFYSRNIPKTLKGILTNSEQDGKIINQVYLLSKSEWIVIYKNNEIARDLNDSRKELVTILRKLFDARENIKKIILNENNGWIIMTENKLYFSEAGMNTNILNRIRSFLDQGISVKDIVESPNSKLWLIEGIKKLL